MSRRAALLFVGLSIAWGIPYLLIKVAVEELSPAELVLGRTTLGAAVRERIHAFNLLHRQQAAQCERNTLYRLASPVPASTRTSPTR